LGILPIVDPRAKMVPKGGKGKRESPHDLELPKTRSLSSVTWAHTHMESVVSDRLTDLGRPPL